MYVLKHLFLGIILLSAVASIAATETLPKEDFESVINKGLSDFMDQFGREKKAELGIEDLVEKQRLAEEQEAENARRVEEAEQQRIKRQEIEQREKREKIALWSSGIDINIQHLKDFQNYNLTYGQLWKTLGALEQHYRETPNESVGLNKEINTTSYSKEKDYGMQVFTDIKLLDQSILKQISRICTMLIADSRFEGLANDCCPANFRDARQGICPSYMSPLIQLLKEGIS